MNKPTLIKFLDVHKIFRQATLQKAPIFAQRPAAINQHTRRSSAVAGVAMPVE